MVDLRSLSVDQLERLVFAEPGEKEGVIRNVLPGSRQQVELLARLSEQAGCPQVQEDGLTALVAGSAPSRQRELEQALQEHQLRRNLIEFGKDASGDAVLTSVLTDRLGIRHNHEQRRPRHERAAEDTTPSAIGDEKLTVASLLAEAKSGTPRLSQAAAIKGSHGLQHRPDVVDEFFAAGDALVMRSFVMQHGFPAGRDPVPIVEAVLAAVPEDRSIPDEQLRNELLQPLQADRQRPRVPDRDQSRSAVLYAELTLEQLLSLRERGRLPHVASEQAWVDAVLSRFAPAIAEDVERDDAALEAYVDRCLPFAADLPPAFVSYRHALLLVKMDIRRRRTGHVVDDAASEATFVQFLGLPRSYNMPLLPSLPTDRRRELSARSALVGNVAPQGLLLPGFSRSMESEVLSAGMADMCRRADGLPPALTGLGELRSLTQLQALVKLQAGEPEARWGPHVEDLRSLAEGKVLSFTERNARFHGPGDAVCLHVRAKGVPEVVVKVFEVNTTAVYRSTKQQVSSDIDLAGLVPSAEVVRVPVPKRTPFSVEEVEIRHPALQGFRRGVFVVEVIGGGERARCVVRKGSLKFVSRATAAGQVVNVLDEQNRVLPGDVVSVMVDGNKYAGEAREDGSASADILVPFAGSQGNKPIIVTLHDSGFGRDGANAAAGTAAAGGEEQGWTFSSLHSFQHFAESYALQVGWLLERQALVKDNRKASVLIRPSLSLVAGGSKLAQAPLQLLKRVSVQLTSTDIHGDTASRTYRDLSLGEAGELSLEFAVPNGVRGLSFALRAEVELMHTGQTTTLTASHSAELNGIETSSRTADTFLRPLPDGTFQLQVLGKSGEPVPGVRLQVHADTMLKTGSVLLGVGKTDERGVVQLGRLPLALSISVTPLDPPVSLIRQQFELPVPHAASFAPELFSTVEAGQTGDGAQARIPVGLDQLTSGVPVPAVAGDRLPRTVAQLFSLTLSSGGSSPQPRVVRSHGDVLSGALGGSGGRFSLAGEVGDQHLRLGANGEAEVFGLPEGSYVLVVHTPGSRQESLFVGINVVDPSAAAHRSTRRLPRLASAGLIAPIPRSSAPLQASRPHLQGGDVSVTVRGGLQDAENPARVHFVAVQFVPSDPARCGEFDHVGVGANVPALQTGQVDDKSVYLNARKLGEEQLYIMERQQQEPRPGNLLPRPSLLLTPWARRSTSTVTQTAALGESLDEMRSMSRSAMAGGPRGMRRRGKRQLRAECESGPVSFDFLRCPGVVVQNVLVQADGSASVPMATLLGEDVSGQTAAAPEEVAVLVFALAVDPCHSVTTTATLVATPEAIATAYPGAGEAAASAAAGGGAAPSAFRNAALERALPVDKHHVQKRRVAVLAPGEALSMTAASDSQAEEYGTVGKVLGLMVSLAGSLGSSVKAEFGWLAEWPTLTVPQQRAKYSKFSCHEVDLFLFYKDRAFFDAVVRPHVSNKRAKSFVDRFLLGHDLAEYTTPGRFERLNAMEKALLVGRVAQESASGIASSQQHRFAAAPVSDDHTERIFGTAISSNALEDDAAGTSARAAALAKVAEQESVLMRAPPMHAAAMAAAGCSSDDDSDCSSADEDEEECDFCCMEEAEPVMPTSAKKKSRKRDGRTRGGGGGGGFGFAAQLQMRSESQRRAPSYRGLDKTEELEETYYYKVSTTTRPDSIVPFSGFWADLASHRARLVSRGADPDAADRSGPTAFLSANVGLPVNTRTELLVALAVLDVPFDMPEPTDVRLVQGSLRFAATASPVVLFAKDVSEAEATPQTTVLVGQNYFDPSDMETVDERGQRVDKYLSDLSELVRGKVYGVQVIITNVSRASRALSVLTQIPAGAVPVDSGFVTKTRSLSVGAYETKRLSYRFYFPRVGSFQHYPVHVANAQGTQVVAHAQPVSMTVVHTPTHVDEESWEHISQMAPEGKLWEYLARCNTTRVNFDDLAWRCNASQEFFEQLYQWMQSRGLFSAAVFGYAFRYQHRAGMRNFLSRSAAITSLGQLLMLPIESPLVSTGVEAGVGRSESAVAPLTPAEVRWQLPGNQSIPACYEQLEYSPLVNARAHRLGSQPRITNSELRGQYEHVLRALASRLRLAASDELALTYHLLLQDRVAEAQARFNRVAAPAGSQAGGGGAVPAGTDREVWTAIMFDYLACYMAFFRPEDEAGLERAEAISAYYAEYPINRWREKFAAVAEQLQEWRGASGAAGRGDEDQVEAAGKELSRERQQQQAAAKHPQLEVEVEAGTGGSPPVLVLRSANVSEAEVRLHEMQVEELFSAAPFEVAGSGGSKAGSESSRFGFVRPNESLVVAIDCGAVGVDGLVETRVELPVATGANVMVEAEAGGVARSVTFFSHGMHVSVMEAYGRLRVTDKSTGRPMPGVYVKAYWSASGSGGSGEFFKDGYTDLRGVFDYTSVGTDTLDRVKRFALLVSDRALGSVVREARPPTQRS